ncbi:MAG: tetratricopeptide repeat protein [Leptospirillum sp.]|jgi:tetratricopeptide (TPR) repeat protein|nr:tetratricopeptide repeat protein [Nitrospiraceae bacterium]
MNRLQWAKFLPMLLLPFLFSACTPSVSPRNRHLALEHYESGLRKLSENQIQGAFWDFEFANHLDPNLGRVHYGLGHVYYKMHDFQDATNELLNARKFVRERAAANNYLGLIEFRQHSYQRAMHYFNLSLSDSLYRTPERPLTNLGRTYMAMHDLDAARDHFSKAILRNNSFAPAHYYLGALFYSRGKLNQALKEYSFVIRLAPKFPKPYYEIGKIYLKLENRQKALAAFEEVVRLDPDSVEGVKASHYVKKLK